MGRGIFDFIFVLIGAFFYWSISGFIGKFDDYMSSYKELNRKYDKNFFTGFAIFSFVAIILYKIFS